MFQDVVIAMLVDNRCHPRTIPMASETEPDPARPSRDRGLPWPYRPITFRESKTLAKQVTLT